MSKVLGTFLKNASHFLNKSNAKTVSDTRLLKQQPKRQTHPYRKTDRLGVAGKARNVGNRNLMRREGVLPSDKSEFRIEECESEEKPVQKEPWRGRVIYLND